MPSWPAPATFTSRPPFGARGFYPRLAGLTPPTLFVWGAHDSLVPPAFSRYIRKWMPGAEQVILQDCGHVPQVECPEQTNELLMDFFARAERSGEADLAGSQTGNHSRLSALDSGSEAA